MRDLSNSELELVNVQSSDRLDVGGTSKGNQIKWYSNNRIIKLSSMGYEDIAEVLVSNFLHYTNVKNFVDYYSCIIFEDDKFMGYGCYSYNFLASNERDITFYRLFINNGLNILPMTYDEVRENMLDLTNLDIKDYLDTCLCLDSITKNEDRHFNNLSVIKLKDGTYRESPIYDNGLSCLSDKSEFPLTIPLDVNISKIKAKPFNTNFKRQLTFVTPILINYSKFIQDCNFTSQDSIRAFKTIKFGLDEMRGVAWQEC